MAVFGNYSKYYNLLYKDKDYAGEADYVHRLIQTHRPGAQSILDLGCGTGRHDLLLAQKGYQIVGVDISGDMLAVARSQIAAGAARSESVYFQEGDIRSVRLDRSFDAVISLFHVISYQTQNEDLLAAFKTVRCHLNSTGVFVFDFWYGPAVLTDRPAVRIKRLEDDDILVTRLSEPTMYANSNCVDVDFEVYVQDKLTLAVDIHRETHKMRYLFLPELAFLLREANLQMQLAVEWMTDRSPGYDTWGVCLIAQAC